MYMLWFPHDLLGMKRVGAGGKASQNAGIAATSSMYITTRVRYLPERCIHKQ